MTTAAAAQEDMPDDVARALKRARTLEWVTLGYLLVDVALVLLVSGNSQAMQAAWVQDLLEMVPPLAFLVTVRMVAKRPTRKHPYGFHQSFDLAYLFAALALLGFGGLLLVQSALSLIQAEHPSVGTVAVLGETVWLGWFMIAVLAAGLVPPLVLGRMKMKLAPKLHNKMLYADAQMNKADWLSSAAAILGVGGIGMGWWWADSVAAIVISLDIIQDGVKNLRGALSSLTDAVPNDLKGKDRHPLLGEVEDHLVALPWVKEVGVRMREQGQVFHVEAFVVPDSIDDATVDRLIDARHACLDLDWKIHDVVIVPTEQLPEPLRPDPADSA
ncbi:cobalt transporter [Citricoccus zhacaiensis]|uniref:Cobalt transporter n=1 Tax=Citricoccus zhacaiensis TaxID=489142 RepID=A0ABQ2LS63_9MICC|nr:cation diffusion facilitator family transporter [Citricoccus zhacaiensis]GGO42508.1 cobalt transporter [Citricoccus zhacaiensis]